ncbi:MAG: hypothetical protein KDE56_28775 [Anaerolineales bacterium]|nr:hypothetical protein [Anaerolineales bacterium]
MLTNFVTIAEVAAHLATVTAVIVGGIWTWLLFVQRRQRFPRALVRHELTCHAINDEYWLVGLAVILQNAGDVLLSLRAWQVALQQALPPAAELEHFMARGDDTLLHGAHIIEWEPIWQINEQAASDRFELEPGESHQFHYVVVVRRNIRVVAVDTLFLNIAKKRRSLTWRQTSLHLLAETVVKP